MTWKSHEKFQTFLSFFMIFLSFLSIPRLFSFFSPIISLIDQSIRYLLFNSLVLSSLPSSFYSNLFILFRSLMESQEWMSLAILAIVLLGCSGNIVSFTIFSRPHMRSSSVSYFIQFPSMV